MRNTKAQLEAYKTLSEQGWKLHGKYFLWFKELTAGTGEDTENEMNATEERGNGENADKKLPLKVNVVNREEIGSGENSANLNLKNNDNEILEYMFFDVEEWCLREKVGTPIKRLDFFNVPNGFAQMG